ncbi:tRNA-splicing endonuclease subunit Sen2 [Schistocerca americana]|uniref:tRNA-splicing endonuclease subunit Sen2 n=1 Tax=Schistocerca americana TaxID=7009 RepID=UPI001F4F1A3B|nr:tRNA-splicing endonuclease subunit Sen2 [Schistocerca americana]XP_047108785.1 tRNA-splicing endonuclease subunit Sen2 [Schistocerca piceifrons]XP_049951289.1 LOW QUALITY PROTEIN: tRNA-splicing endonuclease subunit Sen2 [Schistocerca serialis cubense]
MENVKEPKRKRHVYVTREQPFPVVIESVSGIPVSERLWQTYTGRYNGDCVVVEKKNDIHSLYTKGFFGKGSLSRHFPTFGRVKNGIPPFISERQWKQRNKWKEDSESEEIAISVKVEDNSGYLIKEEVNSDTDHSSSHLMQSIGGLVKEQGPQVFPPDWQSEQKDTESPQPLHTSYQAPTIRFHRDPPKKRVTVVNPVSEQTSSDNVNAGEGTSSGTGGASRSPVGGSAKDRSKSQKRGSDVEEDSRSHVIEAGRVGLMDTEEIKSEIRTDDESPSASERLSLQRNVENEVVVLRDSDSEEEELVIDKLEARLVQNPYPVPEHLHLTLEEAFFLSYALGCLQVLDLTGKVMTLRELWETFRASDAEFVQKYVAYHHFRGKGWVVKSGLKYGGDFLLYKEGPPFYHASYIVLVEVLRQADLGRSSSHNRRSISWPLLFGVNRLAETVGKEILMCRVVWPRSVADHGPNTPQQLARFCVQEVLLKRWVSSQEREELDREEIIE